ncbi:transporter substrate-binding domain-containing protein [Vibrio europaeus]|uniref:Amino acid ABC transporter n=1 Tax=Vibrio europaeus TaxID=300876 RepID=A0A178J9A6_9VIBR|nr:transporter substrate-binding domain-containing protein [Vibrio europaeus]MDC5705223.1 transporter substrate-binding domain-containing protein [Vibrio europaeus]MDC5710502.1 transporter substrate-binding domain-containing protein [Vibrio europaeus]MDC5715592.1 transporter substrate-binding domain-containing protein [Vibrio europaeus]MDC5719753.1 transporter substrate-binding domain-containing protein [Vibrio europaeus]MDC5724359.1 transporter substrate-binding domain-containing protein [Vib
MVRITGPLIIVLSLLLSFGGFAAPQDNLPHIRVCGDAIDWPPYTYVLNDKARGYDVDILEEVFTKQGISYDITMTSWSRCLRGAKNGEFDLALSASFNVRRDKEYLYTDWYYAITPHYVYSTERFPNGLVISNVKDLGQYRVCGNHGYNYSDFQLSNITRVGHSVHDCLEQVREGKCDIYLNWAEILHAIKEMWGIDLITDELVSVAVPEMKPHKFYMLISRKLEQRHELKRYLDQHLRTIRQRE